MIPLKDDIPTERYPIVTVALIIACVLVFAWQLSFSDSEPHSTAYSVISERTANTIEYGAIPYRLLNPGAECELGAAEVSPGEAEAAVVCRGTEEYREAAALHRDNRATIPAPEPLDAPPWYLTILTSMFMHGGFLHIVFNMLFLWVFGNNVEDAMGRLKFLLFYLAGGAAAVYAQALIDPSSTVPTIGASGAVAAVLGAYALLHPRARVHTLVFVVFIITVVQIPAFVLLAIWFLLQFLPALGQVTAPDVAGESVAYMAHIGGFVFGLLLVRLLARKAPGRYSWT
ncbi:MAG TPA: rhomboid family intramembrane serine protease [Solirubrobacterales bacterium]|nr:rhomboid family intramembrane serine protease [Solirubrobacterales bacterium]